MGPYELFTGLQPQGPVDGLFRRVTIIKTLDPSSYVSLLGDHLKSIHDTVADQLRVTHSALLARDEKRSGSTHRFTIGDHVFLKRVPATISEVHDDDSHAPNPMSM